MKADADAVHFSIASLLADEASSSDAVIHQLRVATKRLRALWQLARPLVGNDPVREAIASLRDASAGLSAARDQTVMLKTLRRLAKEHPDGKYGDSLRTMTKFLQENELAVVPSIPDRADLRVEMCRDRQRWEIIGSGGDEHVLSGFKRLYRKGRKLTRIASTRNGSNEVDLWHESRKWVKFLSLVLPLCGDHRPIEKLAKGYGRLGKRLGKLHDYDQLLWRIKNMQCPERLSVDLESVSDLVESRRAKVLSRCDKLAKKRYKVRPKAFVDQLRSSLRPAR